MTGFNSKDKLIFFPSDEKRRRKKEKGPTVSSDAIEGYKGDRSLDEILADIEGGPQPSTSVSGKSGKKKQKALKSQPDDNANSASTKKSGIM